MYCNENVKISFFFKIKCLKRCVQSPDMNAYMSIKCTQGDYREHQSGAVTCSEGDELMTSPPQLSRNLPRDSMTLSEVTLQGLGAKQGWILIIR